MKLRTLKMKFFLIHEDRTLAYTGGLNVVRGKNEHGKSSTAEAFAYLLVGATALEKSLEDTVNYNAKSKAALRVEGEFSHDGVEYKAYRSATGAEITRASDNTVLCTGQKPVTQYIENLLGLPAGRFHHITFASQNAVRGVLAIGPTAASEFIEKLAGFSEIDALIRKAVDTLPSGDTKILESQIAGADEALQSFLAVPEVPDHSQDIATFQVQRSALLTDIKKAREQDASQTAARNETIRQRNHLTVELSQISGQISAGETSLAEMRTLLSEETELKRRAGELEQVFVSAQTLQVYREVNSIVHPAEDWEGSEESLRTYAQECQDNLQKTSSELAGLEAQAKTKASQKILSTTCPTCHQTIGDPAEAARLNAAVDLELAELSRQAESVRSAVAELQVEMATLRSLEASQKSLKLKSAGWPPHLVEWDLLTVPNKASFKGARPAEVDLAAAETEYARLQKKLQKIPVGGDQVVAVAEERQKGLASRKTEVESKLAALTDTAQVDYLVNVAVWEAEAETLLQKSNSLLRSQEAAAQQKASVIAERSRWESAKAAATADLAVRRGNTEFIKALKEARLRVSEKLWGTVMAGVSNYFSRLRGKPSVVSRSANGFLIDGKAGRPSGSTLNILGLALRIVLAKVFANTGLLFIDEPSAGCDMERTANMAAVVSAAGFEQVIWISHDDIAEIGSANLIEI